MDVCDLDQLRPILARHGFRFSKSMGQNFLIAPWVPERTAAASGADRTCGVLEIGPGVGPLTRALSLRAGKVTAVELDRDLLPILEETLADCPNTEVVNGDLLELDLPAFTAEHFPGLTPMVCANLPYNITTPAVLALLQARCFASVTLMVQREAAQRICAVPGEEGYGAFSVLCRHYAQPEILFDVPPNCFFPAPKVTSAVVRLVPRALPDSAEEDAHFVKVVRAAFSLRRKTLLNCLNGTFGKALGRDGLAAVLQTCGLPAGVRGETLSAEDFAALSAALDAAIRKREDPTGPPPG